MDARRSPRPGPRSHRDLDRRTVLRSGLTGLGAVLGGYALSACSSEQAVEGTVFNGPEHSLAALFPRDVPHIPAAVPTRLPYTVLDVEGVPLAAIDGPLEFAVSFDGQQVGDPVQVASHGDGVPRPYLPLTFTFPNPGIYDVTARFGEQELQSQVQVFPTAEIVQPVVGSTLPSVNTPTTAQSLEVDPVCSAVPTCPFHETDLAVALTGDKPVVVLLATPAYCRTTACGPILELLVEVAGGRDDIVVIHSEVYKNPKAVDDLGEATLAPLPLAYQMTFEPALFVTNAAHEVTARGDIVVDRAEMADMLATAV